MGKDSLSSHLKELYRQAGICESEDDFKGNLRSYYSNYNRFYALIKMERRNKEADKFYVKLINWNATLDGGLSKRRGRKRFINVMRYLYRKQQEYLIEQLEGRIQDYAKKYRPSDALWIINSYIANNSVGIGAVTIDDLQPSRVTDLSRHQTRKNDYQYSLLKEDTFFLEELENGWNKFQNLFSMLLETSTSDVFFDLTQKREERLRAAFEKEKGYYLRVKKNKKDWFSEECSENFYRNLYILVRNRYLKYYYIPQLIDINIFDEIKNYECYKEKDKNKYSLRDIACIYRNMLGLPNDNYENKKVYDRFKKLYSEKKYTQKFKEKNRYQFSDSEIYEAISAYVFLKRKDIKEEDFLDESIPELNLYRSELDSTIRNGYARLLEVMIKRKNSEVKILKEILDFFKIEYNNIFDTLNHEYQRFMFDELIGGMERIVALFQGIDESVIY